jgi:hypothetical protein
VSGQPRLVFAPIEGVLAAVTCVLLVLIAFRSCFAAS